MSLQADQWEEFFFISDSASGIQNVTGDRSTLSDTIYNLSGQRLTAPQKGINIINGKKVVTISSPLSICCCS